MRVVSTLAVLVALASAFFLYALGYDTRRLEAALAARERAADQARSDISTLKAERAYLARPERIEPLARGLGLRPVGERQLTQDVLQPATRAADASAPAR